MKIMSDQRVVSALAQPQAGVFSTSDLRSALRDPHPAAFARRVNALISAGVLRRFVRGWYVTSEFDLAVLSQRLAPASAVSFGNVLARELLIGAAPSQQVLAIKVGSSRTYRAWGLEVRHLSVASHLYFGFEVDAETGVRFVDPEKAILDVLYFHLRGQRFFFDPFSDIDYSRVRRARMQAHLGRYRNPKFVAFAARVMGMMT